MRSHLANTLLTCIALVVAGAANAQGRGPDAQELRSAAQAKAEVEAQNALDPAVRATRLAELDSWLRRLVGKFSFDGTMKRLWGNTNTDNAMMGCTGGTCYVNREARGSGDCVSFGDGPGVHCVINVPWPRFLQPVSPFGEIKWSGPYLDGAGMLLGIDPDNLGLRFMLVDGQSIAYTELGSLQGDMATFETRCPPGRRGEICRRFLRITARADGRMEMQYELTYNGFLYSEFQFTLRRVVGKDLGGDSRTSRAEQ